MGAWRAGAWGAAVLGVWLWAAAVAAEESRGVPKGRQGLPEGRAAESEEVLVRGAAESAGEGEGSGEGSGRERSELGVGGAVGVGLGVLAGLGLVVAAALWGRKKLKPKARETEWEARVGLEDGLMLGDDLVFPAAAPRLYLAKGPKGGPGGKKKRGGIAPKRKKDKTAAEKAAEEKKKQEEAEEKKALRQKHKRILKAIKEKKKVSNVGANGAPEFGQTGLAAAPYYLGALGQSVIQDQLLKAQGDFAVHMQMAAPPEGEEVTIVVHYQFIVKTYFAFHTQLFQWTGRGWTLDGETTMEKLSELVEHHVKEAKPTEKGKPDSVPKTPKERPHWLLRDSDVVAGEKVLGKGNFGVVLLGRLKTGAATAELEVVVKRTNARMSEKEREDIYREASMMLENSHPHLVLCYGMALDTLPYQIVMEKCGGGSLDGYLLKEKGKVEVGQKQNWCAQAAKGCAFLEERRIVHRDIAARNCLLRGKALHLKVADMGMARKMDHKGLYEEKGKNIIPVKWASPEALDKASFSAASDAFALGVLFWEIFHEAKPWADHSPVQVLGELRAGKRLVFAAEAKTPADLLRLAQQAFSKDPSDRPSLASIAQQTAHYYSVPDSNATTTEELDDD